MFTLDFDTTMSDLRGNELPEKMSDFVPDSLANNQEAKPIKAYELAKRIATKGKIEVDREDYDLIYASVEKDKRLSNLGKGQILLYMKEALDGSK